MLCLLEFIGCGKITLSHRYRTCFPLYEILTLLWLLTKARFDLTTQMDPGPTTKLLDVAGGTGDIAFRFMNKVCMSLYMNMQSYIQVGKEALNTEGGASVVVCDINKSMLQVCLLLMENPTSHLRWVNRGQVIWDTPPAYLGLRAMPRCPTILLFG